MRKLLLIALLSAALAGCGQGEPAASQADASSQLPAASSQAASEPVVSEPVAPDVSSAVSSQPTASAPPQAVSAAAGCQRRPQPVRTARAVNGFGQQNPVSGKPDPQYERHLSEPE